MISHRSDLFAVVIGGMYNPLYARMLEEFASQLHASGRQMLLVPVDSGHSLERSLPTTRRLSRRCDRQRPRGAFARDSGHSRRSSEIPVILFNTKVSNAWVTSVSTDNARAGAEIADHFLARGARSFGFVTGPLDSPASAERLKGFRRTLARRGFKSLRIALGDFRYEDGFRVALAIFRSRGRAGVDLLRQRSISHRRNRRNPHSPSLACSGGCARRGLRRHSDGGMGRS